jgi:hypothetical protein
MTASAVPTGPTSRSTTHCTAAWGWLGPGSVDTAKSAFMIRQLPLLGRRMQLGYCTQTSAFLKDSDKWSLDAIERSVAHKGKDGDAVRAAYHRGAHCAERVEMAQWWANQLETLRTGAEIAPLASRRGG